MIVLLPKGTGHKSDGKAQLAIFAFLSNHAKSSRNGINTMGKASALFYSNAKQTLHDRVTPTIEQREFLQAQWNRLADYLKVKLRETHGFPISTWIQGSYKYGTLIRPIHPQDAYDVDVGVYFEWDNDLANAPTPTQLREWVQQELMSYGKSTSEISEITQPAKERCSRIVYADRFHIDTPVYHLTPAKGRRRLACLSGQWEDSDPKPIYKWFRDAFEGSQRDQVRRVIRYMKGWAAVAFTSSPSSRPSSILLTVLVSEELGAEYRRRWLAMDDEVALTEVVRRIQARLLKNPEVSNPVVKTENLNRIEKNHWDGFLVRLQALRDAADRAESANTEASGALAWSEAFSFLMPLPNVLELQVVDEGTGRQLMLVPDVQIRVGRKGLRGHIAEHLNAAPPVETGYSIEFSITNPEMLPEYPTIEWTVRYCGMDRNMDGALGRRQTGVGLLSVTERTEREGTYSMDCVVRVSGSVYAVRRIPFHVGGPQSATLDAQPPLATIKVMRPTLTRT